MSEDHIWKILATKPEDLGYRGALSLHYVQLGKAAGYIDLLFLPDSGQSKDHKHRLVLIEAKRGGNAESSDKVIGQLLKYYARALQIGRKGLQELRQAGKKVPDTFSAVSA